MTLHAGHCTRCDAEIWRFASHGRTGEPMMLYPAPTSTYARVLIAGHGVAPGIGYCQAHTPVIGDPGPDLPKGPSRVVAVEAAGLRYAAWYAPAFGRTFAAWLQDHCELPDPEREALILRWEQDRQLADRRPIACAP